MCLPVNDDDSAVRYVNGCNSGPGCVCWHTEILVCRLKEAHCLILHRQSIFKAGWKAGGRHDVRLIQMANSMKWQKQIESLKSSWKVTLCIDPDRYSYQYIGCVINVLVKQNQFWCWHGVSLCYPFVYVCHRSGTIVWPKTLSLIEIKTKTHSSMLN